MCTTVKKQFLQSFMIYKEKISISDKDSGTLHVFLKFSKYKRNSVTLPQNFPRLCLKSIQICFGSKTGSLTREFHPTIDTLISFKIDFI